MADQDQHRKKDDVDELHALDDVDRTKAFVALLEQDPQLAARALLVLTKRYGGDPLLTAVLLEWLVALLGVALGGLHTLETHVFGRTASAPGLGGGLIVPGP
jgi:hypothetical protein